MTREEAIAYFEERRNYNPHNGNPAGERLAIEALRTQQELESKLRVLESNEPLTLDELREMDGEPVWLVGLERGNGWVRIEGMDSLVIRFSVFGNPEKWCFRTASYGGRVWAYRQKPAENFGQKYCPDQDERKENENV